MNENNIIVRAQNRGNKPGFDIVLSLSGIDHYLMWHRHNGLLYSVLSGGISLSSLRRVKPFRAYASSRGKRSRQRMKSMREERAVDYLLNVIDWYLADLESGAALPQAEVPGYFPERDAFGCEQLVFEQAA